MPFEKYLSFLNVQLVFFLSEYVETLLHDFFYLSSFFHASYTAASSWLNGMFFYPLSTELSGFLSR